jgi:hypothetical protein
MAGSDKKMYKQLASEEGNLSDLELLSPSPLSPSAYSPPAASHVSPRHATSKKMLYYLKATLNASYAPEYDFSYDWCSLSLPCLNATHACLSFAKSTEFSRESSYDFVCRNIEGVLLNPRSTVSGSLMTSAMPASQPHSSPWTRV